MAKEEDKILEILRDIYYNPQTYTREKIEEKYGEDVFKLFDQFAYASGDNRFVNTFDDKTLCLSAYGAQEYHRMVAERQNQQIAKDNVRKTKAMILATISMAGATLLVGYPNFIDWITTNLGREVSPWEIDTLLSILALASLLSFFGAIYLLLSKDADLK